MTTIAERVAAGAAFLDERDPDWWRADVERAIDLEDLDLNGGRTCVLGQRCPMETLRLAQREYVDASRYDAMAFALSGYRIGDWPAVTSWAEQYGFMLAGSLEEYRTFRERDAAWAALTAEWKRVITGRRAAS